MEPLVRPRVVWSEMAEARNTSLADLHTTQTLVSDSFVCNAVRIPFWICAHGFAICTPFLLPTFTKDISLMLRGKVGGARLI